MKRILSALLLLVASSIVSAQTNPGFVTGQIPTAAQWNSYFSQKADYHSALGLTVGALKSNGAFGFSQASCADLADAGAGCSNNIAASGAANFFAATPNGVGGIVGLRAIVAADVPTLNQSTTGTAAISTTSTSTATSTNASFFPTFVSSSSTGNQGLGMHSGLSFNPSTNALTTTTFVGALTGNVTGTASGNLTSAANSIALANIAQIGANRVLGNSTSGTANVAALTLPSCTDTGGQHINYVLGTGFACGTSSGASGPTFANLGSAGILDASNNIRLGSATTLASGSVTGGTNLAIGGAGTLNYLTSSTNNIAIGTAVLDRIDTSASSVNVVIGDNAMHNQCNSTGGASCTGNVVIGHAAVGNGTYGQSGFDRAVIIGNEAEGGWSNTGGPTNGVAIGYRAGYANKGANIVAVGAQAALNVTTGIKNTCLGASSCSNTHNITTASNNVDVTDGDGVSRFFSDGSGNITINGPVWSGPAAGLSINLTAPAAAAAGGNLVVNSGPGGATSGASGTIAISSGTTTVGDSGAVSLGSGAPTGGSSGTLTLSTANANGTAKSGGNIAITAGNATTSGGGGNVTLTAGTSPSGTAGAINLVSATQLNGATFANPTAPTLASGGCTSPTAVTANGSLRFSVGVGTSCSGSQPLVFTLPAAAHGWNCYAQNSSNAAISAPAQSSAISTTSVTVTNYVRTTGVAGAWTDADVIVVSCLGG